MSDADREGVFARLNAAAAEGRLTLAEFEERVDGVLQARTYGEVEPFLADLPAATAVPPAEVVVLNSNAGQLKRKGRWAVPRKLMVRSRAGQVTLDLRHAVFGHRVVEINLNTEAGSTTIVLPPAATADIDGVATHAGTARSKVPSAPESGSTAPHVIVTGSTAAGMLLVRYERRLWRWTW
jgi:hypothetical protein